MTKKIIMLLKDASVSFNVNWFEYLILRKIFRQKRYNVHRNQIKGDSAHMVVIDESTYMGEMPNVKLISTPSSKRDNYHKIWLGAGDD